MSDAPPPPMASDSAGTDTSLEFGELIAIESDSAERVGSNFPTDDTQRGCTRRHH